LKVPWARCQWLIPVILATQEAEISRIAVQSHPGQDTILKTPITIKSSVVVQGKGLEFKPQYHKKSSLLLYPILTSKYKYFFYFDRVQFIHS
jgi:hypothetical protein